MQGQYGGAIIQLRTSVEPTALTLEHIHESIAPDYSTAPKEWELWVGPGAVL